MYWMIFFLVPQFVIRVKFLVGSCFVVLCLFMLRLFVSFMVV